MAETLEKIQDIFKEAKTLALFSKKNEEEYKFLAKEALKHALLQRGADIISLAEHPEFRKKWKKLLPEEKNIASPCQTSIRIPKSQHKIRELNYEENKNFFSLIVTSENGELKKESIVLEPVPQKIDAAFCFFEPAENVLAEFENKLTLPPKEKIIFFASGGKTFAEKIFQVIKTIAADTLSLQNLSTLLFASLITETSNFTRPINQEALRFGGELLSIGADKELVKIILREEKTISSAQFLGRALARTRLDKTFNVSWTFLSQKDFEKTGNLNAEHSFFYSIGLSLREIIPLVPISLIFWQTGKQIFAMAMADEKEDLEFLGQRLAVSPQSKFFIAGPFSSFLEAELSFQKALGKT